MPSTVRRTGRRYAVIYHDGAYARSLGEITDVSGSHRALDPFLSRLLLDRITHGELLLIDKETGGLVVKRQVRPQLGR